MESDRINLTRQDMHSIMESEMRASPSISALSKKFHTSLQSILPSTNLQLFAEKICTSRQLQLVSYDNINDTNTTFHNTPSQRLSIAPSSNNLMNFIFFIFFIYFQAVPWPIIGSTCTAGETALARLCLAVFLSIFLSLFFPCVFPPTIV